MPETFAQTKQPETRAADMQSSSELHPAADLLEYMKDYARENPEVAALWCLGIGFILGWKLKPW